MQTLTIEVLMDIWGRTIGNTPVRQQFEIWAIKHSLPIIKDAILTTAQKNLTVPLDNCSRFADEVMIIRTKRAADNLARRAK